MLSSVRSMPRVVRFLVLAVLAGATAGHGPTASAAPIPTLSCTPPAAEPEIAALARALRYNLPLIYEYVY